MYHTMESERAYTRVERMIARLNGKRKLIIRDLPIKTLPPLPDNLEELVCYNTKLTALPARLPPHLRALDITYTDTLTALPDNLPNTLQNLQCFASGLRTLPNRLPTSLIELDISKTHITTLPDIILPSLKLLEINNTKITHVPDNIARNLTFLSCFEGKLKELPNTMDNIQYIGCMDCPIKSIPTNLPQTLNKLTLFRTLLPQQVDKEETIDYITRIDTFKRFSQELTGELEKRLVC